VVKLPYSREPLTGVTYDSIWVLADYLTKYAYFIPYKEESSARELVYMVIRNVIANYGVSRYIVSDRVKAYVKVLDCFNGKARD
jgi:hypothetical protein